MGLLTSGEPLSWSETKQHSSKFRQKGIQQFIQLYRTFKSRNSDYFKYGDEIEYTLVKFDHLKKRVYLLLKAEDLLDNLNQSKDELCKWSPEFASFMIEGLPGRPYEHDLSDILKIESNMKLRRETAQRFLSKDEFIMTFSTFPLLGCENFTWPNLQTTPHHGVTKSQFFPDDAIFQDHPKYAASIVNNRSRRETKMSANIPIFKDAQTPTPFLDPRGFISELKEGHVYLEGIGGSCSCLQVTFQATNLDEAKILYDQLIPITPLLLALSASSPIWRGFLCDIDCRWQVLSEILDDRTPEEKGQRQLNKSDSRVFKSRYDSVDCYLSEHGRFYNDLDIVKEETYFQSLIKEGVDDLVAQHVAHLFIRDPLILFKENVMCSEDRDQSTDEFENIQSTNWQSMRFKPPPSCDHNSEIGWRVEFRTTELQVTDFENAAFVAFLVLLTRAILTFKINWLIPISKVDENMKRAQKRNAYKVEKFHFKVSNRACVKFRDATNMLKPPTGQKKETFETVEELCLNEIFNGCDAFVGLIPVIRNYLSQVDLDIESFFLIEKYLKFVEQRANGKCKTNAEWMRDFVRSHPKYKSDSVVTDEIAYDLMWRLNQMSNLETQ